MMKLTCTWGGYDGAMWQPGCKRVKFLSPRLCHLGEQLVKECLWGGQGVRPILSS